MAYRAAVSPTAVRRPTRLFVSSQPSPDTPMTSGFAVLSEEALRCELSELIRGMGGRPTADMLEVYLSVYRPDLAAARAFHSREPVPAATGLTVVGWSDSGVSEDGLDGWARFGDVTRVQLTGDHYAFLSAPPELLRELTDWPPRSAGPPPPLIANGRKSPSWTQ